MPNLEHLEHSLFFFLIEDLFTISGYSIENNSKDRFTAFTNDQLTIESYQKLIEKVLVTCNPLLKVYNNLNIQTVAETIVKVGKNNDPSYFMADELFFSNMSYTLLANILDENGCNPEEKERALNFQHQLNRNFGRNVVLFENHHIYYYSCLEKCAIQANYLSNHLSMITGCSIRMTRQHFIEHIESTILRLEKHADYKVALSPCENKNILLKNIDIWIKDGRFLCAWSNITYEKVIISIETSVTHVFSEYYQQLWQSIPFIEKDKTTVMIRLNKLLRLARNLEVQDGND